MRIFLPIRKIIVIQYFFLFYMRFLLFDTAVGDTELVTDAVVGKLNTRMFYSEKCARRLDQNDMTYSCLFVCASSF